MKDQKERYRQAKEELKRVQEDFRSLRDRLKVEKSFICFFYVPLTSKVFRKAHSLQLYFI